MADKFFENFAHEVFIPLVVFPLIAGSYMYERYRGTYSHSKSDAAIGFFREARNQWVVKMHLSGQAAANTTRDYLRVILFLTGNSILLATVFSGFAAQIAAQDHTPKRQLLVIKLNVCVIFFMILFFCFLMSARYATHFHFIMNVENMYEKPIDMKVIQAVFNHAHRYYQAGTRLYYFCIPLFAWTFSAYALLAVAPFYLYIVRGFESLDWMHEEMRDAGMVPSSDEEDHAVVELGPNRTVRDVMKMV